MQSITAKECWNVYAKAVGGKTYDGKPLPEYSKLGTQKKGWLSVAKLLSNQLLEQQKNKNNERVEAFFREWQNLYELSKKDQKLVLLVIERLNMKATDAKYARSSTG